MGFIENFLFIVINGEIKVVLFVIGDDKVFGLDSYNVYFLREFGILLKMMYLQL